VFVAERTTTGPSLTAREREVVMAVLQGRSNAEVAREQFVSVRTVESHLHRAMKKLGVTRRSELRGLVDHHLAVVVDGDTSRCGDSTAERRDGTVVLTGGDPAATTSVRAVLGLAWSAVDAGHDAPDVRLGG
jgi:DNA-binding CsgD family transcriptional regulator